MHDTKHQVGADQMDHDIVDQHTLEILQSRPSTTKGFVAVEHIVVKISFCSRHRLVVP